VQPKSVIAGTASDDVQLSVSEPAVRTILTVLDDADCHAILRATSEAVLSARELAGTCDIPLSTVYRKLGMLTDTGLLEERTRIRESGKHASEYTRFVGDICISFSPCGTISLQVIPRQPSQD
jgi:DNA-binding transcriptional ArsR family regulator